MTSKGFPVLCSTLLAIAGWALPGSATAGKSADLAITKAGPADILPGGTVTYTVNVTNQGPNPATLTTVVDATPNRLTFVSNSGACTTAYPCALATVASGATRTITSTYLVPADYDSGSIVNTASVSSSVSDPVASNDSATAFSTVTPTADLSISNSGPAAATAGEPLVYTLIVTNNGNSDATGVTVQDPAPAGLTFVSNAGACSGAFPCVLGVLPTGTTRTITTTFLVPPGYTDPDPVVMTAMVSSITADPVPANNTSSSSAPLSQSADLSIHQTAPDRVAPGTNLVLAIAVTNQSASDAAAVAVTIPTPEGLTFVSNTGSCTGAYPCPLGDVTAGTTRTIITTYAVPAAYTTPDPITVTATVSSSTADPIGGNNSAVVSSVVAPSADLSIESTAPATVTPGEHVVYTHTITNTGPSDAASVSVENATPAGLTFISNAESCTSSYPCALGAMPAGSTRSITTTYLVPPDYRTPDPIVSSASVSSPTSDPASDNNMSTSSTAVGAVCGDGVAGPGEQCDGEACCDAVTCQLLASTTVCRAGSADTCDPAERCSGSSASCPQDVVLDSGTTCRDSSGSCDAAETCSGVAGEACPADGYQDSGTLCRASTGVCDEAERCTGTDAACPADAYADGTTVCRTGSGDGCDPDELCTGTGASCPDDARMSEGTVCRAAAGVCDAVETCSGDAAAACPADAFEPAQTVCRAGSGDLCDADELCTGAGADCPEDVVSDATTVCRAGSGDMCDPAESCSGQAAAACPADVVRAAGTVCRESLSMCDQEEICSGEISATCPDDVVVSGGSPCIDDGNPCTDDVCNADGGCGVANTGPCDDGSICTTGDRCSDGVCSGTALDCSDDDLCSQDTCDPVAGCVNVHAPAPQCFGAASAKLTIKNSPDPVKNRLGFFMATPDLVPLTALGVPRESTAYGLCLYDLSPDAEGEFVGSLAVPPGPVWTLDDGVVRYFQKLAHVEGVREVRAGYTHTDYPTTRVRFTAVGSNLVLPFISGTRGAYFAASPAVVVQVVNSTGACWSVEFGAHDFSVNTTRQVKAKRRRL